ncbi:hypothetical protein BDN72DRAFT_540725 [Pluteus cervinus]|uniref:Uncharacterized protein n=1 Tax=Pluteus cervinus TaxID=181527 RepID=A0ACD3AYS0_9AGAR|nr:hypothetical protein BDN72DRAFT_540725 [Pluteus cervinus]
MCTQAPGSRRQRFKMDPIERRRFLQSSPRNMIAALGTSDDAILVAVPDWRIAVVPQEWELEPDSMIKLPTSTSKSAVDAWAQANVQNIPTVFCTRTKVLESEKVTGTDADRESSDGITQEMAGPSTRLSTDASSPINFSDIAPELPLKLGVQVSRVALMFNIAITSMELWQSNDGERREYVLVHLAWYPQGRHCATSDGNSPAHFSAVMCLERNPGTPGFVPSSVGRSDDTGTDSTNLRTSDYFSAASEGEFKGTCLLRLRFVGNFLPSFIDLMSATWVLHTQTYAYNLLEYSTFWYADTLMALMTALEGVESETELVKERVYRNLGSGLRRDLRKNGFNGKPVNGKATNKLRQFWVELPGRRKFVSKVGLRSKPRYTKGFPFSIDKRFDAKALEGAKKEAEQEAARLCFEFNRIVDERAQPDREKSRKLDQTTRAMHEEIVQRDISLGSRKWST